MSWLKLDDAIMSHPKMLPLTAPERLLYIAALCHCAGGATDGKVSKHAMPLLLVHACAKPTAERRLVDVGLWRDEGDHYLIPDYLLYNPSKAQADATRAANAARKAKERANGLSRSGRAPSGRFTEPEPEDWEQ